MIEDPVTDVQPEGERCDPLGAPNDQDTDEFMTEKCNDYKCQDCKNW